MVLDPSRSFKMSGRSESDQTLGFSVAGQFAANSLQSLQNCLTSDALGPDLTLRRMWRGSAQGPQEGRLALSGHLRTCIALALESWSPLGPFESVLLLLKVAVAVQAVQDSLAMLSLRRTRRKHGSPTTSISGAAWRAFGLKLEGLQFQAFGAWFPP